MRTFITARIGHSCLATLRGRVEGWRGLAAGLDSDDVIQRAYQERETMRAERDALRRRVLALEGFLRTTLKEIERPWLASAEKNEDGSWKYTAEALSEMMAAASKAGYARLREARRRPVAELEGRVLALLEPAIEVYELLAVGEICEGLISTDEEAKRKIREFNFARADLRAALASDSRRRDAAAL